MTKNNINRKHRNANQINFLHTERGRIYKNIPYSIRVALVYPNYYYVGMSNLGFQAIYSIMNTIEGIRCERAFLPEVSTVSNSKKVLTIETKTPIEKFDIIAFSISFENDLFAVLNILQKSGLALLSKQRNNGEPLIMLGGVLCLLNPEPLSPFFDCLLIGEAEDVMKNFFDIFDPSKIRKNNLINLARQIPNLYVPSFFHTEYNSKGTIKSFRCIEKVPNTVERAIVDDISKNPINTNIITPNTVFKNTFLIEVSRGCHHGCRFCSAGYIYRPPRFQSEQIFKEQIRRGIKLTSKVGLIGSTISDYPNLEKICSKTEWKHIHFSFSSLRADNITDNIINILRRNNTKTATIAPDAGSERLRKVINKGITEEHIINAIKKFVLGGIPNIKLYFIIGLPTETYDDINAIIILCKKIKNCFLEFSKSQKQIGRITISLNPFIPKPFTPFQWFGMNDSKILKKKINFIRLALNQIANISVHAESIRTAYTQALISRGDRRVAKILLLAHSNNYNWPKTLKKIKKYADFFVYRKKSFDEILPWDFLKRCVTKQFLIEEYKLAMNNYNSKSCYKKVEKCNFCGVCNS